MLFRYFVAGGWFACGGYASQADVLVLRCCLLVQANFLAFYTCLASEAYELDASVGLLDFRMASQRGCDLDSIWRVKRVGVLSTSGKQSSRLDAKELNNGALEGVKIMLAMLGDAARCAHRRAKALNSDDTLMCTART